MIILKSLRKTDSYSILLKFNYNTQIIISITHEILDKNVSPLQTRIRIAHLIIGLLKE
jgi:hypothetical protein